MPSYQGHLLVASPYLPDPNFYRSVVLMIQHDEEGAVGLVLNRPTDTTVDQLWNLPKSVAEACRRSIHQGGPVSDQFIALHRQKKFSERMVFPGVHLTTQIKMLGEIAKHKDSALIVFSGYAGWAGGQLENELEMGGWMTKPATVEEVFGQHDDLWRAVVQEIGLEIIAPSIKGRMIPADPSMN
jgi:putative transcriptional regulator